MNFSVCVAPGLNCLRKIVPPAPWKLAQIRGLSDSDTGDVKLFTGEHKYTSQEDKEVYILMLCVNTWTCILEPLPCCAAPADGGKLFIRWGSLNSALGAGECKWGYLHHSVALHPAFRAVRTRTPSCTCKPQWQQGYRKPPLMQSIHRPLSKDSDQVEEREIG